MACDYALSMDRLFVPLCEIFIDKALGLDDFHCEFYIFTWEFIGFDLLPVH